MMGGVIQAMIFVSDLKNNFGDRMISFWVFVGFLAEYDCRHYHNTVSEACRVLARIFYVLEVETSRLNVYISKA
jgi:hypothetical protein